MDIAQREFGWKMQIAGVALGQDSRSDTDVPITCFDPDALALQMQQRMPGPDTGIAQDNVGLDRRSDAIAAVAELDTRATMQTGSHLESRLERCRMRAALLKQAGRHDRHHHRDNSNADHWEGRRGGKTGPLVRRVAPDGWPAFPTNPRRFQIKLGAVHPATRDPAYCMRFSGGNRSICRLLTRSPQTPTRTVTSTTLSAKANTTFKNPALDVECGADGVVVPSAGPDPKPVSQPAERRS
jgi:hypothetical protein